MKREYHKWSSPSLGRDMEMLVFGHAGIPVLVFPTSCGRFYEFEDRGMVESLRGKIEQGHLQLFCVDSVDAESWYNRAVAPRWRIARHVQYVKYIMHEVVSGMMQTNPNRNLVSIGCSFGGYHAINIALRHPDVFHGALSMSGAFDLSGFLGGYYDDDVYFNIPVHYLPNMADPWYLDRYRHNNYILATGEYDHCWNESERMARAFRDKSIPCRLDVWGNGTSHDWPYWQKMLVTWL